MTRNANLSPETENEIDRVFSNLEFFETREHKKERIVADCHLVKEMPKKRLNRE